MTGTGGTRRKELLRVEGEEEGERERGSRAGGPGRRTGLERDRQDGWLMRAGWLRLAWLSDSHCRP